MRRPPAPLLAMRPVFASLGAELPPPVPLSRAPPANRPNKNTAQTDAIGLGLVVRCR
jgi:hypothetical protein